MTAFIANARMYSVAHEVEAAWQQLLAHIADLAQVPLVYVSHPAPAPLESLWARYDLGCVFMCGYPIALKLADIVPLAAPVPSLSWALGRAAYRTDFIVRRNSPFLTLEDTFGGRFGWTVAHSHSGFNAPRHHLMSCRTARRPTLYGQVIGNLVTARRILDAVVADEIDTGPLDAYWHALLAMHRPDLVAPVRIVASTALAPMPAFVASPSLGAENIARLQRAFAAASAQPWFAGLAAKLLIQRFVAVEHASFATTLEWDREAIAAGYPLPA